MKKTSTLRPCCVLLMQQIKRTIYNSCFWCIAHRTVPSTGSRIYNAPWFSSSFNDPYLQCSVKACKLVMKVTDMNLSKRFRHWGHASGNEKSNLSGGDIGTDVRWTIVLSTADVDELGLLLFLGILSHSLPPCTVEWVSIKADMSQKLYKT